MSRAPKPNHPVNATEAAQLYAEDATFAEEFDRALGELYREQKIRLDQIARRIGMATSDHAGASSGSAFANAEALTPGRLKLLFRDNEEAVLTRGEIALKLGVQSGDVALTRALRMLKADGVLRQIGERRGARYALSTARSVARSEPRRGR